METTVSIFENTTFFPTDNLFSVSCSSLTCPAETFKCVVSSEAIFDDPQNMRTVVECINKKNEVLEEKEYIEVNPYPELKPLYSRHTSKLKKIFIRLIFYCLLFFIKAWIEMAK